MDHLTNTQQVAHEKLFKWIQTEIRSFTRDIPDLDIYFKTAIGALRSRSVLFQLRDLFFCLFLSPIVPALFALFAVLLHADNALY